MAIPIIELESHNEVLRAYIISLLELGQKVHCYTNKFNYDQLYDLQSHPDIKWILSMSGEKNNDFFIRNFEKLYGYSTGICSTLPEDMVYDHGLNPIFEKFVLVIHDAYAFSKPWSHLYPRKQFLPFIKDCAKMVRYLVLRKHKNKQQILASFKNIVFPSVSVDHYVRSKMLFKKYKIGNPLCFAVPEMPITFQRDGVVRIVIPGIVSDKSRDYELVYHSFKKVVPRLASKIELILLGNSNNLYAEKWINSLKSLQNPNFKLTYFTSFIPQEVFDQNISNADFLLLPIKDHMRYLFFKERNGYTCVSGNINDHIRYAKPAILPEFYPLDFEEGRWIKRYRDSEDMSELILGWCSTDMHIDVDSWKKSRESYLNKTLENLRTELMIRL